jgi:hypothetical protein
MSLYIENFEEVSTKSDVVLYPPLVSVELVMNLIF